MTTYLAKQVIGSNVAANPAGALLQSGANRADDSATGDTWLFLNTVGGTANPWGIFHSQVDNKIKIFGSGTEGAWVKMNTGEAYLLGRLSAGGVTLSNTLECWGERYNGNYGIHMHNSDIIGINSLRMADNAETYGEGIMFVNGSAWDCMAAAEGTFYFRSATDGTPALSAANSTANIRCNLLNTWKFDAVTSLNADDVRTTNGIWVCAASITNAAMTNHSVLFGASNVGTPFQLQIPDSSHLYIYKRWYSSGAWSSWSKISAGYADSAASATYLKDRTNSTASYLNYGASGLAASAITWLCCWNGYEVRAISKGEMANAVDSSHKWVRLGGDTMSGTLAIVNNTQNNSTYNALLYIGHTSNNDWGAIISKGSSYDYGLQVICKSDGANGISVTGRITGTKVYGAVWNDYAECRSVESNIEAGRVVYETNNRVMQLAHSRLQPGCKVVSDTYGMCIGETEEAKTPIAVTGRVLVYPYHNKTEYELGTAVCSAPNGTVDIMTREEIREYPERIIGTVSEIPDYDVWHAGERDGNHDIEVKGRIWIYVR